ncbi:MFS transporter [Butyrivibrio sp. WCE2006]|uniref:MFS transporter n=1 Tax=Butyrivibrio sp. WCE2006 TaxID=1410611 RepID=UPI0005D18C71|nr:MFS transporter [Butyrivibrio sp. WCE2006]
MEQNISGVNRAKWWQIAGLAVNDVATNLYMWEMIFISYYLNGIVGAGVVIASSLATVMRLWDGITDPIIGIILDKTGGKFGKNRPFLVIGQLIMLVMSAFMFFVTPKFPKAAQFAVFVIFYALYIIGYTCQCVVTKSAQTCLTNDPKQRPTFGIYAGIFGSIFFTVAPLYSYTYLLGKHQYQFGMEYFQEMWVVVAVLSFVLTAIAYIAIRGKDKPEFYGIGNGQEQKVSIKDYIEVLKKNRALQMLVISASTDKLATSMNGNATVAIIVYAIICKNAGAAGLVGTYTLVPSIIILFLGIGYVARKFGQMKGFKYSSYAALFTMIALIAMFIFGDPTQLSLPGDGKFAGWNTFSLAFVVLMVLYTGFKQIAGSLVYPMTADCTDYEVYRSGKYVPGLIGTVFSFIDKLISSLAPLIIGVLCAAVSSSSELPTAETPYSAGLAAVGLFCMFGIIIFGYLCNIIAMHFYPLTKEKMESISADIARIKRESTNESKIELKKKGA